MVSLPVRLAVFPCVQLQEGAGSTWSSEGGRGTSASPVRSVDSTLMNKGATDVSAKLFSHLDQEFKHDLKSERPNNAWGSWLVLWFHRKEWSENKLLGDGLWQQFTSRLVSRLSLIKGMHLKEKFVCKKKMYTNWWLKMKEKVNSEVNSFSKGFCL